jgi:hypothetical protein
VSPALDIGGQMPQNEGVRTQWAVLPSQGCGREAAEQMPWIWASSIPYRRRRGGVHCEAVTMLDALFASRG